MKKKYHSPNSITDKTVDNMNLLPTLKYGIAPNEIEKKSLSSKAYKEWFDIRRLRKYYQVVPLEICENVVILSSRLKKKDSLGLFYKSSTDNQSYFTKKNNFYHNKETKH